LSLSINSSGVLEAAVSDIQSKDTRRFKKGDSLFCRWRLPDIDSINWPLKARGIVYKRAYRRCRKTGTDLMPYMPKFSGDGSRLIFNTRTQGVWVMNRRGKFNRIPGFELVDISQDMVVRLLVPVKESREFFVLQTYKDESFISMLFDSWKSDIRWIPDLMFFRNSSLIMSRGNSRVESLVAVSRKDFMLADALAGAKDEAVLKNADSTESKAEALLPGEEFAEGEENPEIDWPWLDLSRVVQEKLLSFKSIQRDEEDGKTELYFMLNNNRIGRLIPGETEMTLYPEIDPYVFRDDISRSDSIAVFRLLDQATVIILGTNGLYRVDLMTGHHEMAAEIPWQRIKYLYGELALSPDHQYAAFRAWTTAQRQEIFLVELATGRVSDVVKGEMDLRFIPGQGSEARLNPSVFNFTPDGMALVTLWRVLDGQEMRVYRLLDGKLAPVPPKIEPEEDEENAAAHAASVDKKIN